VFSYAEKAPLVGPCMRSLAPHRINSIPYKGRRVEQYAHLVSYAEKAPLVGPCMRSLAPHRINSS